MLTQRAIIMRAAYEKLYAERGGITPSDTLEFHFYHLARYWSRLVGFCRQDASKPEAFINSDLGACVEVATEFAHGSIKPSSPIYGEWQHCWKQTQAILYERPVTLKAVEAASQAFNDCLAKLKYNPCAKMPTDKKRSTEF
jgi:hypothetical protein